MREVFLLATQADETHELYSDNVVCLGFGEGTRILPWAPGAHQVVVEGSPRGTIWRCWRTFCL